MANEKLGKQGGKKTAPGMGSTVKPGRPVADAPAPSRPSEVRYGHAGTPRGANGKNLK